MKAKVSDFLQSEIDKNSLESVILQVSKNGEPILQEAVGTSADTAFDVGTLMEVVIVLPAILKLVERRRKKLALNHTVAQYIPAFGVKGKENIQIMNLLTHTSGLPNTPVSDLAEVYQAEIEFSPGSSVAYSEMNFRLLPQIFEQVAGMDLAGFLDDFIFNPLRMNDSKITREENGQIKLFSTLSDLSHFATMIEQDGTYDYMRIIKKKELQLSKQNFTSFLNENRGLGWQLGSDGTSYGHCVSNTSMWFDSKKKLTILFHVKHSGNYGNLDKIREGLSRLIQETV